MTDYYVIGSGHTAYGPYKYEEARKAADALACDYADQYMGRRTTVHVTATTGDGYSKIYDEELPERPEGDVYTPWRDEFWYDEDGE